MHKILLMEKSQRNKPVFFFTAPLKRAISLTGFWEALVHAFVCCPSQDIFSPPDMVISARIIWVLSVKGWIQLHLCPRAFSELCQQPTDSHINLKYWVHSLEKWCQCSTQRLCQFVAFTSLQQFQEGTKSVNVHSEWDPVMRLYNPVMRFLLQYQLLSPDHLFSEMVLQNFRVFREGWKEWWGNGLGAGARGRQKNHTSRKTEESEGVFGAG